jgi:hypothetical protein
MKPSGQKKAARGGRSRPAMKTSGQKKAANTAAKA